MIKVYYVRQNRLSINLQPAARLWAAPPTSRTNNASTHQPWHSSAPYALVAFQNRTFSFLFISCLECSGLIVWVFNLVLNEIITIINIHRFDLFLIYFYHRFSSFFRPPPAHYFHFRLLLLVLVCDSSLAFVWNYPHDVNLLTFFRSLRRRNDFVALLRSLQSCYKFPLKGTGYGR